MKSKESIVLVEDNPLIQEMVTLNLQEAGYQVSAFHRGKELLDTLDRLPFDLFILDIMLPDISGMELVRLLRARDISHPILMLTVKKDIHTKIKSLDLGADDYLVKPFHVEELLARIRALLRRTADDTQVPKAGEFIINRFRVNTETRMTESREGEIQLSEKEFRLLLYFRSHPSRVLSRDDILEEVWGMDVDPTPRTVDNFILKFRKLYEDHPEKPHHFKTVRNRGYIYIP